MIFKLQLDRNHEEEIIATVHQRTPLIDEIERLVTQDSLTDSIPGYQEEEIVIGIFTLIFIASFAVIWLIIYLTIRTKVKRINRIMQES